VKSYELTSIAILAPLCAPCQLPLATHLMELLTRPSSANTGFESARLDEDAHTRQWFGRYQPGYCQWPYISRRVHHSWLMAIRRAVYLDCRSESSSGFLVLTGYALGPGHRNTRAFPDCTTESTKER
jgi:hypothetical protein